MTVHGSFSVPTRWALAVVTVMTALVPVVPSAPQGWLQAVVVVITLAMVCWGILRHRALRLPSIVVLLVGLTLTLLTGTVVALGTLTFGHPLTPTLLKVSAAVGYLGMGVGLVMAMRHRARLATGGWAEAAIFGLGALAPVMLFAVLPILDGSEALAGRLSVIAGAVTEVMVITVLARLVLSDELATPALSLFGLCVAVSTLASFWAALHGLDGRQEVGAGASMLLTLVSDVLMAAGACHPSVRRFTADASVVPSTMRPRAKVALLTVGLMLPALSLSVSLALGRTAHLWLLVAVDLPVAVLVAVRLALLVTRIAAQSAQLAVVAHVDDTTGLPNRRGWRHELSRSCARAVRNDQPLSIAVIELDHFAEFNGSHGRPTGDRFLQAVVSVWSGALAAGELLGRDGGVQFVLALPGADLAAAERRVEELRRMVPRPQTASAGVAQWRAGSDPEAALLEADSALYVAKCDGRDRTVASRDAADALPGPLRDIQTALQPIVRFDGEAVVAYECLSRFPHTTAIEWVFADAYDKGFGDLLEATALSRVLEPGRRPEGVEIFVNVSERAMRSERFWEMVPTDLTGVVIELLELHDGLSDVEVAKILDRFRRRGARIALDDVGSASTDFARIASLRPDVAKIDRSLVTGCDTSASQAEVLRMIVQFARSHGAEVVVEGVETVGELEVARAAGATHGQGYLLGRPQLAASVPFVRSAHSGAAG